MRNFIFILLFSFISGQVIEWKEKPEPVTALQIFCDMDGIPIFVDGIQIGISPIKDPVQVAPGWHQVSYFPPQLSINSGSVKQNRIMRDMISLARQDILVEEGSTVKAILSYRTIESQALEYEQRISSKRWIGFSMILLIITFMIWGII